MRPRGAAPAVAATLAAALLALAPGPAASKDGPNLARFDWSMPSRLGHRVPGERILDYPQSAAQVPGGPFVVDFDLAAPACAGGVTRAFAVRGRAVEAQRLPGPCSFRLSFEREGTYDVGVHVKGGGRDDSYSHDVVVQDFLIVAIGDSVASGEGNPDNRSLGHPEWEDRRCHRSEFAGTAQAAQEIEDADPRSSVTFVHLACSGATVVKGLLGPYVGAQPKLIERLHPLPPQLVELEAIARAREVDAVLMSEGGNDVGFSNVVAFCLLHDPCDEKRIARRKMELPEGGKMPLDEAATATVGQLRERFAAVDARLPAALPRDRVYALEYFDPTHRRAGEFCHDILGGLDQHELRWAYERVLLPLDGQIRAAAGAHGWRFVGGVTSAFADHGYCAPDRWVRRLEESLAQQGFNYKGTLHPTEDGHRRSAELIDGLLRPALLPNGAARRPRDPIAQANQATRDGLVPAQLAATPDTGGGLSAGVIVLLALAAAGLTAAVIVIARRRRRPG